MPGRKGVIPAHIGPFFCHGCGEQIPWKPKMLIKDGKRLCGRIPCLSMYEEMGTAA